MIAHKLHVKWSVRLDATPARLYELAPRLSTQDIDFENVSSWTLMLNDGVHVMHSDVDQRVKLRHLDTGEVVWESPLRSQSLCHPGYEFYGEDIIFIFYDIGTLYVEAILNFLVTYLLSAVFDGW
jgi:hypothetical protein